LLTKNKYLNDLICNFSFAYPIGIDVQTYRSVHLPHHQYLNEDKDPDLDLYTYAKKQLFGSIIKDFLGITAINRLKVYSNISRSRKKDKNKIKNLVGKFLINFSLISILSLFFGLFNGFTLYISLWVFPIVSIFPIIIRMRTISEHSPSKDNFNKDVPLFIARTTKCNFIEKYVLGSQMEYHFEHHIFPNIPYRSQKLMHDMLWIKGYFRENLHLIEFNNTISSGYISSTKKLIKYSS
jgi:fatty acid desaturase